MCIYYSGEISAYLSAKRGSRYHTQSLAKFLLQSCSFLGVDTTREEHGAALPPASLRRVLQLCYGEGQELTTLSGRSLIIWLMYLVNGRGAAHLLYTPQTPTFPLGLRIPCPRGWGGCRARARSTAGPPVSQHSSRFTLRATGYGIQVE